MPNTLRRTQNLNLWFQPENLRFEVRDRSSRTSWHGQWLSCCKNTSAWRLWCLERLVLKFPNVFERRMSTGSESFSLSIAVVTLQTFYLGSLDLLTSFFKCDRFFPRQLTSGKFYRLGLEYVSRTLEFPFDSYPKSLAREKWNTGVASQ